MKFLNQCLTFTVYRTYCCFYLSSIWYNNYFPCHFFFLISTVKFLCIYFFNHYFSAYYLLDLLLSSLIIYAVLDRVFPKQLFIILYQYSFLIFVTQNNFVIVNTNLTDLFISNSKFYCLSYFFFFFIFYYIFLNFCIISIIL